MKNKASLSNLPSEITIDILSRLPIKTIPTCKCVCRKWLELLSSAEFAEFHFSRSSTPGLLVHKVLPNEYSCNLFEDVIELQRHDFHCDPALRFDPTTFISSNYGTWMLGSVNGLLCLHQTDDQTVDAFYICNPITREYITLPRVEGEIIYPNVATNGVGVSSSSGQYKLVRINHGPITPGLEIPDFACWIYTLGTTGSWRSIGPGPARWDYSNSHNSVFLNGNLHWLAEDEKGSQLISCFDLETELFKPFSLPRLTESIIYDITLSVLRGCLLYVCFWRSDEEIVIWMMKDYGDEKSWRKEIVISKPGVDLGGPSYQAVYPIKVVKDGEILILWEGTSLFYHSSNTETAPQVDMFKVHPSGCFQAMLHTASFLSLERFAVDNVASF